MEKKATGAPLQTLVDPEKRKEYQAVKQKYKKTTVCYYYWRQRCYFSKERCKFAHGITDLRRYPNRDEFLNIRKTFFQLKGLLHGIDNPNGVDPNSKESKVDDLIFSSDEEDTIVFKQKRKSRSKAEHDKLKEWEHYLMAEFAQFIFKESGQTFLRRSYVEDLFHDIKLKFDLPLLTEKNTTLLLKNVLMPPSLQARLKIFLLYIPFEALVPKLSQYLRSVASRALEASIFPLHYKEFEKLYNEGLPIDMPELQQLYKMLNVQNEHMLARAINGNPTIMKEVANEIGEFYVREGFLLEQECSPKEQARLIKKLGRKILYDWKEVEDACNSECFISLQFSTPKDRAIRGVAWKAGLKYIQTGARAYAIRLPDPDETGDKGVTVRHTACPYLKLYTQLGGLHETEIVEKSVEVLYKQRLEASTSSGMAIQPRPISTKDNLIDGKIYWVDSIDTLREGVHYMKKVSALSVDLEGGLSVQSIINNIDRGNLHDADIRRKNNGPN